MDAKRFPSAAAFVQQFERGLDAHPFASVKGSAVRQFVSTSYAREIEPHLPPALRAYYHAPPLVSAWCSEVHFNTLLHAVFDGPFAGNEGRFLGWVKEENRTLVSSTLYKVIFFVASPERLFRSIGPRWGALRRGTGAELLDAGANGGRIRIHHPKNLYTDLVARVRATSMAVIAESSGARNVRVVPHRPTETSVEFAASWSV
ncbi:MAG: hypothetical protein U0414_06380 [Polyangiaceae bacterium]